MRVQSIKQFSRIMEGLDVSRREESSNCFEESNVLEIISHLRSLAINMIDILGRDYCFSWNQQLKHKLMSISNLSLGMRSNVSIHFDHLAAASHLIRGISRINVAIEIEDLLHTHMALNDDKCDYSQSHSHYMQCLMLQSDIVETLKIIDLKSRDSVVQFVTVTTRFLEQIHETLRNEQIKPDVLENVLTLLSKVVPVMIYSFESIHSIDEPIEEFVLDDVVMTNPEAEKWVRSNKQEFQKRYGGNWQRVLYGAAWNRYGKFH